MPKWDVHFDVRVRGDEPVLVRAVERSRAIAETIRGIPVTVGVRKRLNALNIARAVRGTAAIEGTRISEDEAMEVLEAAPDRRVLPPDRARDELEARNAQAVLEFVQRAVRADTGRLLDEPLIRKIHRLTTAGVPYEGNTPGEYRSHAVTAGDYRPPDGTEVPRLMTDFVRWFNHGRAAGWDAIVRAAIAHFYVVSIHPFGDGNGRASRGVESFLLYRAGINAFGFYSLANFYYQHRDAYVDALTAARFRSDGDLTDFALFAVEGLASELETVRHELLAMVRVITFRDYAREKLEAVPELGSRRLTRMLDLIRFLTEQSLLGVRDDQTPTEAVIAMVYERVGQRTIQRDLRLLVDQGLLIEREGRQLPNVELMSEFTEA
ncbi:MAG: Fic family protein [Chloroflexota bacterium]|nr:Fic family protein [Chloroflexota bacterium]MDE2919060.1 Fic family protein [Chloroflexota bacterium]